MKIYSRIFILITGIFFLLQNQIFSTEKDVYDELFIHAEQLKQSNCLKEAATEYKRYLFMQDYSETSGKHVPEAFFSLSDIYSANSDFDLAINYFQNGLNLETENIDCTAEQLSFFQCQHIKLLSQRANKEKSDLGSDLFFANYLYFNTYDNSVKKQAFYSHLENLILTNQWELLPLKFTEYIQAEPDLFTTEQIKDFSDNLEKILKFKPKNPMLAAHLSFIPGLGQLYAHDFKDSLNAFLLDGSLIALCVYSCCTLNFWEFSLFELSPTIRFYKGNIINAQKATYKYNDEKIKELSQPLLTIISQANDKIYFENINK